MAPLSEAVTQTPIWQPRLDIPDRTVLIPGEVVDDRIEDVGHSVNKYIVDSTRPVVFGMIQTGGVDFGMRLKQRLHPGYRQGFIVTSRYSGGETGGRVTLKYNGLGNVSGCNVILCDDIGDGRNTLDYVSKFLLLLEGAAEVKTCVMLNKSERKEVDIDLDWVGFNIPNAFVWGRGLDGGDESEEKRNDYDVCFSGEHPGGPDYTVPTSFPQ